MLLPKECSLRTHSRMKYSPLLTVLLISACAGDSTAPKQNAILGLGNPAFIGFTADAYTAAQKSGSFWAVAGQSRSLSLRYADTGEEFLRFTVGSHSLTGDSVRIDVSVADDGSMRFHFEPSGLHFNPNDPAELRVDLGRARVGPLTSLFASIWRQDLPGLPWLKLPTIHLSGDNVESDVQHFTDFGMAVN
ncbi:MAG TPA: hypothetical protein VM100_12125 [Longimicrobiales bacterium]|nr:hypothetical protein [Longimicrobiales bacterium]